MNRVRLFTIMLGCCLVALLAMPSIASADNYTTTTPLQWHSGGTLTGSFQLDASGNPINWDFASSSAVSNLQDYTPSDEGSLPPVVTAGATNTVYTFSDQFATGLNLGGSPLFNGGVLSIIVDCQGVANCLADGTAGEYFTIVGATESFTTWSCAVNGSQCSPSISAPITLDVLDFPAYINVSGDPTLGLDGTPVGTAWTPNGNNGGGGTTAPEPATLALALSGIVAFAAKRRRVSAEV